MSFIIDKCYNTPMDEQPDYSERLEAVYQAYEKCLDLDVALALVPMSTDTKLRLLSDPDLAARVTTCDARVKESMAQRLRDLGDHAMNESVRLQALKELGRTMYPKRFKEGGEGRTQQFVLKRADLPEEWNEDLVKLMLSDLQSYVDESDFPTEAEFCYTRGVGIKKVKKYLKDGLELMSAKRQAMLIRRGWSGEEPVGTFLTKLSANADEFSLVDKHELGGPNGEPIPFTMIRRVVVGKDGKAADVSG
jgi:hypothetical protein